MRQTIARLFMITALLMSAHTSAGTFMDMGYQSNGGAPISAHCADMLQKMSGSSDSNSVDKSTCHISCCMLYVASSMPVIIPALTITTEFQALPLHPRLQFNHDNFRPPISV